MYIIPAIDLVEGKCVRLIQGQYNRQITYQNNPFRQAQDFISIGAEWLHIIDLDGAKIGKLVNIDAISAIIALGKLKIEVGGGIRNESSIEQLLDMGVERVIVGTKAVNDFKWLARISEKFNQKIVVSIDARGSRIATEGWIIEHSQGLIDFAKQVAQLPLAAIIYTDITKDGMLEGPNLERTKDLVETVDLPIIAAGGVTKIKDVKKLMECGVEAAIIGRALYEGTINLSEAIKATK